MSFKLYHFVTSSIFVQFIAHDSSKESIIHLVSRVMINNVCEIQNKRTSRRRNRSLSYVCSVFCVLLSPSLVHSKQTVNSDISLSPKLCNPKLCRPGSYQSQKKNTNKIFGGVIGQYQVTHEEHILKKTKQIYF